ncbi:hypothetical protein PoB_002020600 [Plakobranchus ocellatus]|uniref:Uncharacterized protein n=1 Tax=Plakobranchus ocellatus TaxID=259542 RepID=A0AAV3ZGD9_9GAST|nr:hypothetical protein PoB_002020600 [Plakobranchus ocellatus]
MYVSTKASNDVRAPMKFIIDDDATPVAHHTPIPAPIHWQELVKGGLDLDVWLGVIKLVPNGTPLLWCHWMVICAKKSGIRHVAADTISCNPVGATNDLSLNDDANLVSTNKFLTIPHSLPMAIPSIRAQPDMPTLYFSEEDLLCGQLETVYKFKIRLDHTLSAKWHKTEIVIEVHQFDQYVIRVDGSGRVTLRNRKFLHLYYPVIARSQWPHYPHLLATAMVTKTTTGVLTTSKASAPATCPEPVNASEKGQPTTPPY